MVDVVEVRSTTESAPWLPGEVRLQRWLNVGDLADHGKSGDQHNEDPEWEEGRKESDDNGGEANKKENGGE